MLGVRRRRRHRAWKALRRQRLSEAWEAALCVCSAVGTSASRRTRTLVSRSSPPVSSPRRRSGTRRLRELSLANPLVNASLKSLEACSRWALLCKSVRTARRLNKGQPLVSSASGCYLRADSPVAPFVRRQVGQHKLIAPVAESFDNTKTWGEESRRPPRCARSCGGSASAARSPPRWATASRRRSSSSPCSGPSCTASSRPALCGNQPVRRVHRVDGVGDDATIQHERAVKF